MAYSLKRVPLYEHLPLEMPMALHVFPSFYCNFKCQYCLHCLPLQTLKERGFQKQYMDLALYQKAVDEIVQLGWHLKALIFAGHGEPLLHKDIADMVAYAKEKGIADRIEIVTNGSMLTHTCSDRLIKAGLDRLRISLQGVTGEQYQEMTDVPIDFETFVEQLRYFYAHKVNTEVYIKIIDLALQHPGDQERFVSICQSAADHFAVEYAIPFVPEINLGELSGNCKQGNRKSSGICSMPFYMLVLNPNGDVVPCCATEVPMIYGNIREKGLGEIWNAKKHIDFLLQQLDGVKEIPVCDQCSIPMYGLQEGDYLDGYADALKKEYKKGNTNK